jgi:nucleotide-binding universal stress UspA family protein
MRILLAVDGSKHSDWATDFLLKLPFTREPEIWVLNVVDSSKLPGVFLPSSRGGLYDKIVQDQMTKALTAAERLTVGVAKGLRTRWKKVVPLVEKGHIAEAIISKAKEGKADLIILGSRGLSKVQSLLLGSVSQKVTTYAPCSVLVVKSKCRAFKRVLIGWDGSKYSDDVVRFFNFEFQPGKIQGTALFIWEYPLPLYFPKMAIADIQEKLSEAIKKTGFRGAPLFVFGHPVKKIADTVRRHRVDLVAVGSRGLTGLKRFLLGGVSHNVLQYSPTSVLIVKGR